MPGKNDNGIKVLEMLLIVNNDSSYSSNNHSNHSNNGSVWCNNTHARSYVYVKRNVDGKRSVDVN